MATNEWQKGGLRVALPNFPLFVNIVRRMCDLVQQLKESTSWTAKKTLPNQGSISCYAQEPGNRFETTRTHILNTYYCILQLVQDYDPFGRFHKKIF